MTWAESRHLAAPLSSIDLLLDEASEDAVRRDWDALEHAGFSSLGAHTSASNRPHITLLAAPSPLVLAHPIVASLPLRVGIGAPVLFGAGDRRVLARVVTPTAELLALHATAYAAAGLAERPADPHTPPGAWMPHVTLARRIRLETLGEALRLLGDEIDAEVVEMRRWDPTDHTVTPVATVPPRSMSDGASGGFEH
ncbi:2'-5' RNA ligase family protein [Agreia sp. COWG]|uniref:2'-5' RNA ligase family protein n=1 Tax=Agreia sp. COWG TaxID=2773266 RepID=UPI001928E250|nr:2'-5' RNA ligase family protein [Agreia sp. COWG]CAD6009184.1 2'-5' RNA ligase [Agreia sp. COWG]